MLNVNQHSCAFKSAFELVDTSVREGRIPGAVLGMVDRQGNQLKKAVGLAQRMGGERIMTTETWFDLASLTKVIFTTHQILQLAAAHLIDLDAPISTIITDLRDGSPDCWERALTFRQCLGHLTPFPAVEPIYRRSNDPDRLRAFVLQNEWKPVNPTYSDINFILLGIALERLTGKRIREMHAGPGFAFSSDPELTAATEYCAWRGRLICGEVHDENCFALQGAGHAGLFGTVDAVLGYAGRVLVADHKGDRATGWMRQPLSLTRTHGWERYHDGWSGGNFCNKSVIGHTGFTGTGLWIDFENDRAWTLLTNRVHPTRNSDSGIFTLRKEVGNAFSVR
ncbi:class A beta-lactamase-related serine hydrolase [Agrobacterium sp. FDAARGOS_525]|uniref:serine hydrolase domain-containing protein n=1 Tax=Agrobacterium sp. FDAARGOS_525 TaxID=2420311 RepID=UPI000F660DE4|nr:serine hydrolase domain-containing protein [Agrobacterium sp. FDAARGOS_525]RSC24856.1 class A beta-lactamase-related serine hydrolase [Agrobacterium sp. FDAARGOS_525]